MKRLAFFILLAAPALAQGVTVTNGNARFAENGQIVTGYVAAVACGDVNGDSHLDAVLGLYSPVNGMRVMLNDGHGVFTQGSDTSVPGGYYNLALADVDLDSDLDLFVSMYSMNVSLWLNNGNGAFTNSGQILPVGTSLAVADLDDDGSCDLVTGYDGDSFVSVCLNDGSGVFTNHIHTYATSGIMGQDTGDVDGDGDLDIFATGFSDDVLLNNGTGHFSAGWSGGFSWGYDAALGDMNGDGKLDAVQAGNYDIGGTTTRCIMVRFNNGSGQFPSNHLAGLDGATGWKVKLGDLDADGDLDVVAGGVLSPDYVTWIFTNNGHGSLTLLDQRLASGETCYETSLALGDVDEDGALDLLAADPNAPVRPFWINAAPEMAVLGTNGATIGDPTMLVFEAPDAAKGTRIGATPTGPGAITNRLVITNRGPGFLRMRAPYLDRPDAGWFRISSMPATTLAPGGATNLDIVFMPGLTGWDTLTARVVIANGCWHPAAHGLETNMEVWISARGIAPLLTNDYPDIPLLDVAHGAEVSAAFLEDPMESTIGTNALLVYGSQSGLRRGAVSYEPAGRTLMLYPSSDFRPGEWITAEAPFVISNAAGTTRFRPFTWSFHAAAPDGTGHFTEQSPNPGLGNYLIWNSCLGDLNGDGMLDVAAVGMRQTSATNELFIGLNDGGGRIFFAGPLPAPPGCRFGGNFTSPLLADVNGDGRLDIIPLLSHSSGTAIGIWLNDGGGGFTNTFLGIAGGTDGYSQHRLADLDGDGDIDAVMAMWYGGARGTPPVWLNDGSGSFTPITNSSTGPMAFPPAQALAVADFNGDGSLDLFFGHNVDGNVPMTVWFNDGRGRFMDSGQQLGGSFGNSTRLEAGDLDGDGDLDVVQTDYSDFLVWLNDGTGQFLLYQEIDCTGQSLAGFVLADLDADGDLDAVTGNEIGNQFVRLNDGTGTFSSPGWTVGSKGRYNWSAGDINGDGSVDVFFPRINTNATIWLNGCRPKAGFGKALHFDGADDYLLMPGVPANQFSGSNDFTIAMWVRAETNGTLYRLYSEAAADQFRSALSVQTDGRIAFALAKGTVSGGTIATSASPIGWSRWSHVAAVKESNAIRVCVNGVLTGTDTVYSTVMTAPASGGDTYLGATALPVGSFLRGDLDEIQIWNKALSVAQIADWMYRAPDRSHPCISNLVAYLACDEGTALRTTSREGPPIQGDFSAAMNTNAWMDSDVRDWRTWVNHPMNGQMIGSWADGTTLSNLAFEIVGQGAFGTVELSAANGFLFTPPANELGTNVFMYQVVSTNGYTTDVATAYVIVPPDYDEDNMADLWEITFGLNPANPADAGAHSDDDLADNLSEYIADTDPTNAESFFHISSISNVPSLRVYFQSSSNRQYSLNAVTDLSAGVWTNIPGQGPRMGSGGSDWMDDTNSAPPVFYRLNVTLP